ncbi:MAG: CARDB domain-containing protein, partial [Candidatus Kryptoniota bacterium]
MRRSIVLVLAFCLLASSRALFAQIHTTATNPTYGGAPPGTTGKKAASLGTSYFTAPRRIASSLYSTTVFTFRDITVFSYFDSTSVTVKNSVGDTVGTITMRADTLFSISPGQGIFSVSGNKPYSVLIGDAITNYVNGYFALDQSGRGKSTKLNTWMMTGSSYYDPHFIVFAYEDGTQFTIKELETGSFVYAGTLNNGQFLDFPDVWKIQGKAVQVVSNKPVSALSYTDQDYYVPSANGTFAGTLFYGFSGYSGQWQNSITITSYADNNVAVITNLATGDTIAVDTLNHWQVKTHGITKDTFWKVSSTGTLTAANIPFAGWGGNYYYMARSADSTGRNIGTAFVIPTIESQVSIFSYENNNRVKVIELGDTTYPYISPTVIADTLLQAGDGYIFSSLYGNYVYRIESQRNISVVQSSGGWGADFMPLGYTLDLPDLAVAQSDIVFSPPDSVYKTGDQISISVTVHNYGTLSASNVLTVLYDGDPDVGAAPAIGSFTVPVISAGGYYTGVVKYVIPVNAKYHSIYVKVDPQNAILESNESNNKTFRPLKPNQDLLPPLSVYVTAPSALALSNSVLNPNPFKVHADIFNTGTVTAQGVRIQFFVFNGLRVDSGFADSTIGSLNAQTSVGIDWIVSAKPDSSGLNLYTIRVGGSNVTTKDINRGVLVPDIIPPSIPKGLVAVPGKKGGEVLLTWTPNSEKDLAGYKIYYSSDSTGFNGTGANEGPSPIPVSTIDTFKVTGLIGGKTYRFAISALDISTNE